MEPEVTCLLLRAWRQLFLRRGVLQRSGRIELPDLCVEGKHAGIMVSLVLFVFPVDVKLSNYLSVVFGSTLEGVGSDPTRQVCARVAGGCWGCLSDKQYVIRSNF